ENEIVAYDRAPDGSLTYVGAYATGGRGTGQPHLPSQGSVILSEDGRWLLAANAGSNEVSLFAVKDSGLQLVHAVASGGSSPTSAATPTARRRSRQRGRRPTASTSRTAAASSSPRHSAGTSARPRRLRTRSRRRAS